MWEPYVGVGPAPESITDKIYEHTLKIAEYKIADLPDVRAPLIDGIDKN